MQITIRWENLILGDIALLKKCSEGSAPIDELIRMLDRLVVGGVMGLPLEAFSPILTVIAVGLPDYLAQLAANRTDDWSQAVRYTPCVLISVN